MLSLISFLVVLSILIIVHELGHLFAAKMIGVKAERFSLGFGPKLFSRKVGETEFVISYLPLGGYVKLAGDTPGEVRKNEAREFLSRTVWDRFKIVFAGPLLNYVSAFFIFSLVFIIGYPNSTTKVGKLLEGYPAMSAGLLSGDRIVSIDGQAVEYWKDMSEMIHEKVSGESVRFVVDRQGEKLEVGIKPVVKEAKDIFGNKVKWALIGIAPSEEVEMVRYGFVESFYKGSVELLGLTGRTYKLIWSMITGRVSIKGVTGPVGIYVITGKFAELGLVYLMHFMAVLSMSLAIFNLLPIPVLDGGHIIFLIIEKIRGRPLSANAQEMITNFGITLLVVLMLFVFYNDIMRFGVFDKVASWFRR